MDEDEARAVLAGRLAELRELGYEQLVARLLDRVEAGEEIGGSGIAYQIEVQGMWDDPRRPHTAFRVLGSIDDGGWRTSFRPLTDGFLVAPDGTFVGE